MMVFSLPSHSRLKESEGIDQAAIQRPFSNDRRAVYRTLACLANFRSRFATARTATL